MQTARRPITSGPLLGVGIGVAGLIAVLLLLLRPVAPGEPVAALFPLGIGREAALLAVVAADGLPIAEGALGTLLVARSDQPGFAAALYRQGALIVVAANGVFGCVGALRGATRESRQGVKS